MFKCYSDINGNMPCDNGCMCDKCMYEDVEIVQFDEYWGTQECDEYDPFGGETDDDEGDTMYPPFPDDWNILTAIEYYMDCGMSEETATLMADIDFGIEYEEEA